jgi:signal transduction histidine kinase
MTVPPDPRLEAQLRPPLLFWSRAWRYLAAVAAGAAAWSVTAAVWLSVPMGQAQQDAAGAVLALDLALGAMALALLPLRRRRPLAVAGLTTALTTVSVAGLGPATVAIASMATWRRRNWVVVVAAVSVIGGLVAEGLFRPRFAPVADSGLEAAGSILLGMALFAVTVAVGYYIGARRELVASLHDRVRTAERERALTTTIARDAERSRIAREMHDVLAHRISLVALHAGALLYRDDFSRAQTAETAQTIHSNAQLALAELREVLGVLRAGRGAQGIERPQPTLAELPALLADAREAGTDVRLDTSLPDHARDLSQVPETLSRTAFRIVQEALTNARKHAPGQRVGVRISGAPGTDLDLEVRNPAGVVAGPVLPSAGVGLAGLTERAELAGGALDHGVLDGSFVVRARLPWPG